MTARTSMALLLFTCGSCLAWGGESPVPAAPGTATPPPAMTSPAAAPAPVTPEVLADRARAEREADTILAEEAAARIPISTQTEHALMTALERMGEAESSLSRHGTLAADNAFVDALACLQRIVPDQRRALGPRYRTAEDRLAALSRALLRGGALITGPDPRPLPAPAGSPHPVEHPVPHGESASPTVPHPPVPSPPPPLPPGPHAAAP